ncbi:MAG: tetratricopeptide repeat protein [Fischerella sp.]|nr:tetratricopeptide repeat protein [Fischerella sp.]
MRKELEPHLNSLQLPKESIKWYSSQTPAGRYWKQRNDLHLNTAQVIVLLVSPDFLAMDNYGKITKRAMERHKAGKAYIVPVKLRPIDNWQAQPFGELKCLPSNGEPVTSRFWARQDDAFVDIVGNIRREVLEELEEEQRQQQLIRERQQAVIFTSINRFISNKSFGRILLSKNVLTGSIGVTASVITVVASLSFCRPSSEMQLNNFLTEGQNKFERSEYQAALENYTKALEIDPKNINAFLWRGNAQAYLKEYEAAIDDYTQVIRLAPEEADAYMNRAVVYCTLGNRQEAERDYQKAANLYATQGVIDEHKQALDRLKNLQCSSN